ncbi:hypothetical protein VXR09_15680 [Acinetobacter baumannii]|uniref:hypothetical protein n=1 Tax=Acinetobacter baumannii TaxID=470 RepID=UPI003A8565DC
MKFPNIRILGLKSSYWSLSVNREIFLKIGLFFAYIAVIFYYVNGSAISQALFFLSNFVIILSSLNVSFKREEVFFTILVILLFSFSSLFSRSYPYYYSSAILLYGVCSFIIASGFFRLRNRAEFSLFFYCIYLIFLWFNFYKLGFFNPDGYDTIFNNSSRNIVSAFLLLITMFVGASYYIEEKKQPILIYIFTLVSSVILFGRSGIAISFLLLCYAFYDNYGKKIYWLLIFLPLFVFLYLKYSGVVEYYLMEETSFKYGLESPRKNMLNEYMSGILYSPQDLLWGRRYADCCATVVQYGDNPHNSFIVGHARYGIFHTIFFILLFLSTLFYIKKKPVLIFFVVLIFGRYLVDQLGLFSPLDFVVVYIFLLIFKEKRLN